MNSESAFKCDTSTNDQPTTFISRSLMVVSGHICPPTAKAILSVTGKSAMEHAQTNVCDGTMWATFSKHLTQALRRHTHSDPPRRTVASNATLYVASHSHSFVRCCCREPTENVVKDALALFGECSWSYSHLSYGGVSVFGDAASVVLDEHQPIASRYCNSVGSAHRDMLGIGDQIPEGRTESEARTENPRLARALRGARLALGRQVDALTHQIDLVGALAAAAETSCAC